jgi:hypothetical protein
LHEPSGSFFFVSGTHKKERKEKMIVEEQEEEEEVKDNVSFQGEGEEEEEEEELWKPFLNQVKRFFEFCESKQPQLKSNYIRRIPPPPPPLIITPVIPTSTTTTTTVAATTTTATSSSEPDHAIPLANYTVTGEDQHRVLCIMNDWLSDSKNKGKKFRRAHDTTIRMDGFIIPLLYVDSNTGTQPICVICQTKIDRGEPRCKFSVVHAGRMSSEDNVVDLCQTHVSHAVCYAVHLHTLRKGFEMVCFGTCLLKRGGCRQPKKIPSQQQ